MSENTAAVEQEWKPSVNPWLIAAGVMIATFIFALDGTIANVALPHMAGSFSSSRDESMWILTSYLIASTIVIPTVDWFSRLFGRKNFFILSIFLFTLASILCGISQTLDQMIVARVIQGFGGGGIIPCAQAILLESFPREKRGMAMSVFSVGVILAPIIGPVLGGWITDNWSWPWIFYINAPLGFLAIGMAKMWLEDPPYARRQKNVKIDARGFFFLALWLITFQVILDKGNNNDWFNAPWIRWASGVSLVSAILFVWSQLKTKDSLINLNVFKDRNFTAGTIISVVIQAILYASLAILPQFLQSLLGYTAFLSGFSMMPRGIGSMTSTFLCMILSNKVDSRILIAMGLLFIGTGGLMFGFLNMEIANINILVPNFLMGLGMGFAIIPIIALSCETIPNNLMTNASGIQNLLKNLGSAVGTSLVATMISRFSQVHQHYMVQHLNPLNPVYVEKLQAMTGAFSQITSADVAGYMGQMQLYNLLLQQSTLWAFIDSFRIFGLLSFAVIPLLLLMKNETRKQQKKLEKASNS